MKIAVISNFSRSLLNFRGPLLAEMRRRGHDVLAFAPDHDAISRSELTAMGVFPIDYSLSRTGLNPLRDAATIFGLWRLMRHHKPDVSFASILKPVIYGSFSARLAGVKHRYAMIEGLGYAFTHSPRSGWRRRLARFSISVLMLFALRRVKLLIFLNSDDCNEFAARGLANIEQSVVLGGIGVDLNEWAFAPAIYEPVTFILVARLLRDKGIEDYVAAARIVRQAHPAAQFVLLGGLDENPAGITRPEVESWVAEGLLEWPGHVTVRPWLAKASVFVLPSYREGVPRSTQEAMALGLAVITTDVPGCRDTVVEGLNGFLVPPHNPAALAQAMRHFIEHPEAIRAMGEQSRKIAEARFDVHEQNRKLLAFMDL